MVAILAVAAMAVTVKADDSFGFGVWFNSSVSNIEGLALGVPVIGNNSTEGASLAICGNHTGKMEGLQFAFIGFNYARALEGVQLAFVNLHDGQSGDLALQWGFFNQSGKGGIQIGFLNNGKNNALFQLGLININKNGWLPVMIFVNFAGDLLK